MLHSNVVFNTLNVQLGLKNLELGMKRLDLDLEKSPFNEFNESTHAASIHGKRFINYFTVQYKGVLLDFRRNYVGK